MSGDRPVRRPYPRHPPCAIECRCDGNQVYACIGDPSAALRGEPSTVIAFGDTLPEALIALAEELYAEVGEGASRARETVQAQAQEIERMKKLLAHADQTIQHLEEDLVDISSIVGRGY